MVVGWFETDDHRPVPRQAGIHQPRVEGKDARPAQQVEGSQRKQVADARSDCGAYAPEGQRLVRDHSGKKSQPKTGPLPDRRR